MESLRFAQGPIRATWIWIPDVDAVVHFVWNAFPVRVVDHADRHRGDSDTGGVTRGVHEGIRANRSPGGLYVITPGEVSPLEQKVSPKASDADPWSATKCVPKPLRVVGIRVLR
jgi:hypothetical protein